MHAKRPVSVSLEELYRVRLTCTCCCYGLPGGAEQGALTRTGVIIMVCMEELYRVHWPALCSLVEGFTAPTRRSC